MSLNFVTHHSRCALIDGTFQQTHFDSSRAEFLVEPSGENEVMITKRYFQFVIN